MASNAADQHCYGDAQMRPGSSSIEAVTVSEQCAGLYSVEDRPWFERNGAKQP